MRLTQTARNKNAELVLFDCQRNGNIVKEIRLNALEVWGRNKLDHKHVWFEEIPVTKQRSSLKLQIDAKTADVDGAFASFGGNQP